MGEHKFEGGECVFCGASFFALGSERCASKDSTVVVYDDSVWAAVRERIK